MQVQRPLPRYRSHKEVWALKIADVSSEDVNGQVKLAFEDERFSDHFVSAEYVRKHSPKPGGYWVKYADGYESWSPAEAFEAGYTLVS